jgi:ribosomal RNA assembly protein
MKLIPSEELREIKRNKRKLEKLLKIKIEIKASEIQIDGFPEDEYIAEEVIDAINFGFSLSKALDIKNEDFLFEIINIKDHTKRKDFQRIRGRIIGANGKVLKTLATLTQCHFELKDHYVGIIGSPANIQNAQTAVVSIIQGSKHSNVYSYLEKHRPEEVFDLGLREQKTKRSREKKKFL